MYGLVEHEVRRQRAEEIRQDAAVARTEMFARANRESRPYVARDLSWELARYLDTEVSLASASSTPNGAS